MTNRLNPRQSRLGRKCSVDIHSDYFKKVFHRYLKRIEQGRSAKDIYKPLGYKASGFFSLIERHSKLYRAAQKARRKRDSVRFNRLLRGIHLYIHRNELGLKPREVAKISHVNYDVLCTKSHEYQRSGGDILAVWPNNKAYIRSYVIRLRKKIAKKDHEISKLKWELHIRKEASYAQKD